MKLRETCAISRAGLACLAVVGTASIAAGQAKYTVVDLGPIDPDVEFAWSEAADVNAHGQATGVASTDHQNNRSSTLWLPGAAYGLPAGPFALGHLGEPGGRAYGMNDHGQVVGFVPGAPGNPPTASAFRWDPVGGMVALGDLGSAYSIAHDVNNHGWVVGESTTDDPEVYRHAFLHDGTQMIDLGTLGGITSRARAINDLGQVVGESWYDDGDPWNSRIRAFLWLPEPAYGLPAGMHDIDDYSTEFLQWSKGISINERGQVTGWASTINEFGQTVTNCGIWLPEPAYGLPAGWTNLGSPLGDGEACFARDINNHGVIATKYKYDPNAIFGGYAAGMYFQGAWTNLNEMVSPQDQGRWFFESASAINDDGVIVGAGHLDGWPRGFMLVPITDEEVEPCAADIDGDSVVDFTDLVELLVHWGTDDAAADIDGDGTIGFADLTLLLFGWGDCPGPVTGACCFPETGGCEVFSESLCDVYGGVFQGADIACDSFECLSPGQGDTFEDSLVVIALPYSATGTTAGNENRYDEAYCATLSSSPDVVFAYVAPADQVVTISLCRDSAFDTKLSIYENAFAPGNPLACNDDACSSPSFPGGFLSEVTGVQLTAGNTYYVLVDGWGGEAGTYTIDITLD